MNNERNENAQKEKAQEYRDKQAVDKNAGEERGKAEQVTDDDLKGKKVDADPENPFDQPIRQLP